MNRRWILLSLVLMAPLLFLSSGRTSADKPPPPSNQMRIANSLSCTDDAFEENDDRLTAPHLWDRGEILGDGIGYYLAICSGDNDWFAIDAMQSVALTVYIEFINADGDLDLYLYGPDGTLITQSAGVSDFEAISYTPTETNTYYIQVVGYGGAENTYLMGMQGSCDRCRFSYQGRLQAEGAPANGTFEFQFAIYDLPAGGWLQRGPVDKVLNVVDGLFTTDLYLGDPYYDLAYLEVQVRPVGETTWVSLSPRQTLDAAPYARTLDHESGGYAATRIHTGVDGVHISSAGEDGVHISSAGDDGVEVENASFYGLWVRQASQGVVIQAANDGVYVASAGRDGVYADTTRTAGDYGLYTPDRIYGSNLTTTSLSLVAQVTGDQALAPGDVVSAVGLADPLLNSIQHLPQVGLAAGYATDNVVGVVESTMALVPKHLREDARLGGEPVLQLKLVEGPAQPGDYVAIIVLGVAEVNVDPDSKLNILPGQRLTASQVDGHARNLRTELLNDMVVSEGAPVLGIALAAPELGSDTIPVFVTLR